MPLWQVILIVLGANAVAVTAMLVIRRRAPAGSYFHDTQQASGTLTVAGTVFAVVVGFVFLIAFQSYGNARTQAQGEASATTALFHTAEFFKPRSRDALQGDLVCYARAVVYEEWPAMAHQQSSPLVDGWRQQLELRFERIRAAGLAEASAEQNWFAQTDARQAGRQGRLAEAGRLVPGTIWVLLLIAGVVVISFVLFFADRRERALAQAMMAVAVTTAVTASLLTIAFLDRPYGDHEGSISPTAMSSTLTAMVREDHHRHPGEGIPCSPAGLPSRA